MKLLSVLVIWRRAAWTDEPCFEERLVFPTAKYSQFEMIDQIEQVIRRKRKETGTLILDFVFEAPSYQFKVELGESLRLKDISLLEMLECQEMPDDIVDVLEKWEKHLNGWYDKHDEKYGKVKFSSGFEAELIGMKWDHD